MSDMITQACTTLTPYYFSTLCNQTKLTDVNLQQY